MQVIAHEAGTLHRDLVFVGGGHSHALAYTHPHVVAYDPAFAYELAVLVQDGIRRMYQEMEDCFYYITHYNELYVQPPMREKNRKAQRRQGYYCNACGEHYPPDAQLET